MPEVQIDEGTRASKSDREMAGHYTPFNVEQAPAEEPATKALSFLANRREEYTQGKKPERTNILHDITGLLRADSNDVFEQLSLEERKNPPKEAKDKMANLSALKEVMVKMTAREEVDDDLLKKVGGYLVEKTQEDEQNGGRNQETLWEFLGIIPDHLLPEDYQTTKRKKTEDKNHPGEEAARSEPEVKKELKHEQAQLPEYQYRTGEKLETFFKEAADKPPTLKTAKEFVTAARDDLVEQSKQFEAENPDLIAAVDKADEFMREWNELFSTDEKGIITVVEQGGKIVDVNWEDKLQHTEGKIYKFDSSVFSNSVTLGDYIQKRRQYIDKIKGAENADGGRTEGADQALEHLETLLEKPRDKMTPQELRSVFDIITRHADYLEESLREIALRFDGLEEEELVEAANSDPQSAEQLAEIKKQLIIARDIATQVHKREKPEKIEKPERPKQKVRRLFTGAREKLREMRRSKSRQANE